MDKPLLQTLAYKNKAQSHFILAEQPDLDKSKPETEYELRIIEEYGDRDHQEDVFVQDYLFVADWPEKQIAAKQKQILEGVYPLRLRDIMGKENKLSVNEKMGHLVRGTRGASLQWKLNKIL